MTDDLRRVQALIVVDMQTAFVSGDEAVPAAAGLLVVVRDLMRRAREAGALVVQLQNDGLPGTADEPHTGGWEVFIPVAEGDGQHVIRKDTDDGFHQTGLSSLLSKYGVRHLAVCGVMSEMCVSATARSALNLGYHVVLPHDGHATYDIPAVEGLADAVPHTMASRVAEWALGDEIDIIAHAANVQFQACGAAVRTRIYSVPPVQHDLQLRATPRPGHRWARSRPSGSGAPGSSTARSVITGRSSGPCRTAT